MSPFALPASRSTELLPTTCSKDTCEIEQYGVAHPHLRPVDGDFDRSVSVLVLQELEGKAQANLSLRHSHIALHS
jgi:hypothetical protein